MLVEVGGRKWEEWRRKRLYSVCAMCQGVNAYELNWSVLRSHSLHLRGRSPKGDMRLAPASSICFSNGRRNGATPDREGCEVKTVCAVLPLAQRRRRSLKGEMRLGSGLFICVCSRFV